MVLILFAASHLATVNIRGNQIPLGDNSASYARKADKTLCCGHALLDALVHARQSSLKMPLAYV